jgi:regulator of sigma E protease
MTILATIIVLGVLIFVHELGHFAAAKAVGVEVQRFSIGLGPKLFGVRRGETEYVLSAIPLGGYVKMGGMDDEVMERIEGGAASSRTPSPRDFDAKPIWARTFVISAGVIMNMVFAFGVYTFVYARWGAPKIDTTRVGQVDRALLPPGTEALGRIQPGAHIVRIGDRAIEDWGDVQEGLYNGTPGPTAVIVSDPADTLRVDLPIDEEGRLRVVQAVGYELDAAVGIVNPGSPAAKAGLKEGDEIVAVDGVGVESWYDFRALVEVRPGERVELTLRRDGRELIRPVTLDAVDEKQRDGTTREVGKVGVYPPLDRIMGYEPVSLREAVVGGYGETVRVTGMILGFLGDLVTGGVSPRSVGSIVTIGEASGERMRAGIDQFLQFMALFSVNLAILNLLPIPVLDGGHLLFLGIEAVRGRALSAEQRLRWSNVGFLIVMGIMLWALSNDFLRLFGL